MEGQAGCCECFREFFEDNCLGAVIAGLIKLIFLFPLALLIVTVLVGLTLSAFAFLFVVTLLLGIFPYAWKVICDASGIFSLLLTILYPIPMFMGITIAMS